MQGLAIRFLGTGNSYAKDLGCSSCVLENAEEPLLLIDCGHDSLDAYCAAYGTTAPPAIFITHAHYDHIGGLEGLFYRLITGSTKGLRPRFYCPVTLLSLLQQRVANYPSNLAEGGANFWDAFHLIPVDGCFWHLDMRFRVFMSRHHELGSAFGIALPGRFLYTGDTLPIPEVILHYASNGERIFHDCALEGNPAHTGLADLRREYKEEQWQRMLLYHYESVAAGMALERAGFSIARPGMIYPLDMDCQPFMSVQRIMPQKTSIIHLDTGLCGGQT